MKEKSYKIYLEVIRILACYMVVFNHTEENGFLLYMFQDSHKLIYWMYHFISVFVKANVPLFVMVSGALLFNKEESAKDIYTKRIPRMLMILIIFSFISHIELLAIFSGEIWSKLSIKDFFLTIYTSYQYNWSYWYLYGYIAFLMVLPFLKLIARGLDKALTRYLIILSLAISIYPIFTYLISEDKYIAYEALIPTWIAETFIVYPLLGFYFDKKDDYTVKDIRVWLTLDVITIMLASIANWYRCSFKGEGYEGNLREIYMSSFTIINAITIFICIKFFSNKVKNAQIKQIIVNIGRSTFGIYLLHVIIMRLPFMNWFWIIRDELELNHMVMGMIYSLCVFIIGYVITAVARKIITTIRSLIMC